MDTYVMKKCFCLISYFEKDLYDEAFDRWIFYRHNQLEN